MCSSNQRTRSNHPLQSIPRAAQSSVAACLSSLVVAGGDAQVAKSVTACLATVNAEGSSTSARRLALLALGKIGASCRASPTYQTPLCAGGKVDVGAHAGMDTAVCAALASPIEEVATAASRALGEMGIGSPARILPFLLSQIKGASSQPKRQYLLLKALNGMVVGLAEQQAVTGGLTLTDAQQKEVGDGRSCRSVERNTECNSTIARRLFCM